MRRLLSVLLLILAPAVARAASPETVVVTYRFTRDSEKALRDVIEKHWSVTRRLGLVRGTRQLYRGDGFFLEIFTWKDASIPDDPPAAVRTIWAEMERLVDRSGGKSGLEIEEVHRVDPPE